MEVRVQKKNIRRRNLRKNPITNNLSCENLFENILWNFQELNQMTLKKIIIVIKKFFFKLNIFWVIYKSYVTFKTRNLANIRISRTNSFSCSF